MNNIEYEHFIRVDDLGRVTSGFSTAFFQPKASDILLTNQGGYQFRLYQNGEENPALFERETGIPLYKWNGTQVLLRTEEEIEADRKAIPSPPPTPEERLRSDTDYLSMMTGINLPSESAVPMVLDLTYSPNFDKVKHYYEVGLWTSEMVQNAVGKWLTQEEADEILGVTSESAPTEII